MVRSAGVLDDGTLAQLTVERVRRVLSPKCTELGICMSSPATYNWTFSSSTPRWLRSRLRRPGELCRANAFLDALAHYRRGLGLPALSINWGASSDIGMANPTGDRPAPRRQGFGNDYAPTRNASSAASAVAVVGAGRGRAHRLVSARSSISLGSDLTVFFALLGPASRGIQPSRSIAPQTGNRDGYSCRRAGTPAHVSAGGSGRSLALGAGGRGCGRSAQPHWS